MTVSRRAAVCVAAAGAIMALAGCANQPGQTSGASSPASATSTATSASPSGEPTGTTAASALNATVSCQYVAGGQRAKPVDPPPATDVPATGTLTVTLDMTAGPVAITMDRAKAPCTVNSFEALVKQGFYDGTSCHRLVDQGIYILQCGDPTGIGSGGPGYRFADELTGNEQYTAGVVAMANAGPDTNGSQFFIVWADSPLPPDYTIFGTIDDDSLQVVTTIASRGVSQDASPNPIAEAKITRASFG